MSLSETLLFIHKPIADILKSAGPASHAAKFEIDGETAYLFEGASPETALFGLTADPNAPKGHYWTQLLHRESKNTRALAAALQALGVGKEEIVSATTGSGVPIVDVAAVREYLSEAPRADSRPIPGQRTVQKGPTNDSEWVVIDAAQRPIADLAKYVARGLKVGEAPSRFVLVINFRMVKQDKMWADKNWRPLRKWHRAADGTKTFSRIRRPIRPVLLKLALERIHGRRVSSYWRHVIVLYDDDVSSVSERLTRAKTLLVGNTATATKLQKLTHASVSVSKELAA
ncbi:hypothetical protein [Devosia sp. Root413D1]|uniref:hypothetical protein n=1 Tax=Devosia sp. Root413D1 TaxID=1736531 RepID=UPI000B10F7D3|nr:hypothetical protein [Devosia sp. Root413D1]